MDRAVGWDRHEAAPRHQAVRRLLVAATAGSSRGRWHIGCNFAASPVPLAPATTTGLPPSTTLRARPTRRAIALAGAMPSSDVLGRRADRCLVVRLSGVEWSDRGRADRIERATSRLRRPPRGTAAPHRGLA